MKHVRGPWKHRKVGDLFYIFKAYESNDVLIARLRNAQTEECLANARLIAAAPDLLEASTRALLTISDTLRHEDLSVGGLSALEMCVDDLRKAVAKAKGGA